MEAMLEKLFSVHLPLSMVTGKEDTITFLRKLYLLLIFV